MDLNAELLAGTKLYLGCPMFDGRCHAQFAFSVSQLSALCTRFDIALEMFIASGEALVMKARNAIADKFLNADATHLLMIDSDIGFDPRDVLALLQLQLGELGNNPYDVLSAPYPIKRLAWDKVARAAKLGLADADPSRLRQFASDMLICSVESGTFDIARPLEVTQAGTGFMLVRRRTLERFQQGYPARRYRSDGVGLASGGSPELTIFFDTAIEDGEFISEDFMFCRLVRAIGLKVWTCPWVELSHTGSFTFTTRLADLARLDSTEP